MAERTDSRMVTYFINEFKRKHKKDIRECACSPSSADCERACEAEPFVERQRVD